MSLLSRLRSWLRPRGTGPAGERAAAKHLRKQGYRILARNLRSRIGEIDLLAEAPDRRTIVIVEVKARRGDGGPRPEVHVNRAKQYKLSALAADLVKRHRLEDRPVRFDVIGVDLHDGASPDVRHHEAAFASLR